MRAVKWSNDDDGAPDTRGATWVLVYATVDQDLDAMTAGLAARYPGVPIFGATSCGGVFCDKGFVRGAHLLIGEPKDQVTAASSIHGCGAAQARRTARDACSVINTQLGGAPSTLLLHATPGFEERLLAGIEDAYDGARPPVYGGSAADDDLKGNWRVLGARRVEGEGFVLTGFRSPRTVLGSFVSGYMPTHQRGTVTRAQGRIVYEIDGKPAAEVYNRWRDGALTERLAKGGTVLGDTTLHPLGRLVDKLRGIPRYLLSHPHQFLPDRSMSFFTDVASGDELVMMMGTTGSLLERTEQAVVRALAGKKDQTTIAGGILIYCGGCVLAIGDRVGEVATLYDREISHAPFIGAATFGEIGCFTGPEPANRHGNLMCDTVLFQ
jgi:hypothetical protein